MEDDQFRFHQLTRLYAVGIIGAVPFAKLQELLAGDHEDFWAWIDLLDKPYFRHFRIVVRKQKLDLREFMGTELSVNEYKLVWELLRDIVLLGESDPALRERVLRPYLDSLGEVDKKWHAAAWIILGIYRRAVSIPGQSFEDVLRRRMSAKEGKETFEAVFTPRVIPPDKQWIAVPDHLPQHVLDTLIEQLDLSPRTYIILKRSQINRVGQALVMTADELLSIRYFGDQSLQELTARIEEVLAPYREGILEEDEALLSLPGLDMSDFDDED